MSLSALNSPPLIATATAGVASSLPYFEKIIADGGISWSALKVANLVSFAINLGAVSVPGRIDGENQQGYDKGDDTQKEPSEMDSFSPQSGVTLVAPSGWAFAIWGPIFAGELAFSVAQLFLPETAQVASTIKKMSAPFITAQLIQSLWCAAFRPKYKGVLMYISSGALGAAAFSLSKVHAVVTMMPKTYTALQYCLYFLPTSLHFGWLTAASLVNLNGAVAKTNAPPKTVALVGHISVLAASAAGIAVSVTRKAPVFGGVICWALFAIADGMKKRLKAEKKDDQPGIYGAETQRKLSTAGAFASLAAAIYSAISLFSDGSAFKVST